MIGGSEVVTYWSLKVSEWITLAGIVIGPIIAVGITLWIEARRRRRDQKTQTMRMLLNTRHLAGDPAYTIAINMIPVEFNKERRVMAAWRTYIEAVRYKPSPENADAHLKEVLSKQTKLIYEVMQHLGYELPETDIQSSAYAAGVYIERDNLNISAARAWIRIADALEAQTRLLNGGASNQDIK
jgi:hypothetical protein